MIRSLLICAAALLLSGCSATFKSVCAAGQLGEKLGTHAATMMELSRACRLAAAENIDEGKCKDFDQHAKQYADALDMLSNYGTALVKIAEAKDPNVTENVSAIVGKTSVLGWTDSNKDRDKAIGDAAQIFLAVVTRDYRRSEAAKAVHSAEPHVRAVGAELAGHFRLQKEVTGILRDLIDGNLRRPPGRCQLGNDPQGICLADSLADRAALLDLYSWVEALEGKLDAADMDVRAFVEAHSMLEKRIDKIPGDDGTVYQEIIDVVVKVHSAAAPKP